MKKSLLFLTLLCGTLMAQTQDSVPVWDGLRKSLFGDRPIQEMTQEATEAVYLTAPMRADDGAFVPIVFGSMTTADQGADWVKRFTLIVDENPSPMAGVFTFGAKAGRAELETRIRVESYTWIRVIAETDGGKLYMARRFVKASGGCSAPADKDPQEAMNSIGKMRLRLFEPQQDSAPLEHVQLMVSHPNFSGLAMNQVTRLYTPAYYIHSVTVSADGDPVFTAQMNFSISENPNFLFFLNPQGIRRLEAKVVDTHDLVFTSEATVAKTTKQ